MSCLARVTFVAAIAVIACAPSVPRSPDQQPGDEPQPFDAGVDRASIIPDEDAAGHSTGRDGAVKDNASRDLEVRDGDREGSGGADGVIKDARADVRADVVEIGHADTDGDRATVTDADRAADAGGDGAADTDADRDADAGGEDGDRSVGRPPAPGDVRIDELLINPAGTDTNREWIEVTNRSDAVLDLRLLHVADAASEVALDAGALAPGALLVLGQSLDPARNGGAPIAFSFGNTISLNNGGDTIRLCLGACGDGVVLDQVAWSMDPGAAFDGHAAVVVDGADGAVTFCPAEQPFGTAGSFGSPGLPNPPCP